MSNNNRENKNLVSLNSGVSHWKLQRLSAIIIVPLIVWFLFSIMTSMSSEYKDAIEWVVNPINSTLLIFLLAVIFYHSAMGIQVVVEDYVSNINSRKRLIIISNLIIFFLGTISIISVLNIILF